MQTNLEVIFSNDIDFSLANTDTFISLLTQIIETNKEVAKNELSEM